MDVFRRGVGNSWIQDGCVRDDQQEQKYFVDKLSQIQQVAVVRSCVATANAPMCKSRSQGADRSERSREHQLRGFLPRTQVCRSPIQRPLLLETPFALERDSLIRFRKRIVHHTIRIRTRHLLSYYGLNGSQPLCCEGGRTVCIHRDLHVAPAPCRTGCHARDARALVLLHS